MSTISHIYFNVNCIISPRKCFPSKIFYKKCGGLKHLSTEIHYKVLFNREQKLYFTGNQIFFYAYFINTCLCFLGRGSWGWCNLFIYLIWTLTLIQKHNCFIFIFISCLINLLICYLFYSVSLFLCCCTCMVCFSFPTIPLELVYIM